MSSTGYSLIIVSSLLQIENLHIKLTWEQVDTENMEWIIWSLIQGDLLKWLFRIESEDGATNSAIP